MGLVTFVSHRGAPGTTTTALAVAGAWPAAPESRKLLGEMDSAGGVLALRLGLAEDPGLVSLAAATRHGMTRGELWDHAQLLSGGLAVVPGPSSISVATQLLAGSNGDLGRWFAGLTDVDVILDAGRLAPHGPSASLVGASDVAVMVAQPVAGQLHGAAQQIVDLRSRGVRVGWCLAGEGPYSPTAVEEAYGVPVFGTIPTDARGATMIFGSAPSRKLIRTPLVRSATTLAAHLSGWLHDRRTPEPSAGLDGSAVLDPSPHDGTAEVTA